jgi:hypothetical protein
MEAVPFYEVGIFRKLGAQKYKPRITPTLFLMILIRANLPKASLREVRILFTFGAQILFLNDRFEQENYS